MKTVKEDNFYCLLADQSSENERYLNTGRKLISSYNNFYRPLV